MNKKGKGTAKPNRFYFKLPQPKTFSILKSRRLALLPPVFPQLLVIAICLGIYYAMIHFYLFFTWGLYLYYLLKLVIAYEILSASRFSISVPLIALLLGGAVQIFTNSIFFTTLMNPDTAWQLFLVGLIGILIALFRKRRSRTN